MDSKHEPPPAGATRDLREVPSDLVENWYRHGPAAFAYPPPSPEVMGQLPDAREQAALRLAYAELERLLLAKRPLFFDAHPLKRALVGQLGEDGAALILGQLLGQRVPWHAFRAELTSLHDYAREHAHEYQEIIPAKPVHMSSPELFGEEPGPGISGVARSFFACVLRDVVVTSKSNFLLAGTRVLMDYQGEELGFAPLWFDLDPGVLAADGTTLTMLRHDEVGREPRLDEALSLVGMYTYNYAHWIIEKLFKVLACMDRPGFESVPILIDEQMQPAHREMLELFLGPGHPIVVLPAGASVEVSRLWALSGVVYWPGCEVPGSTPLPHEELGDAEALAGLLRRIEPRLQTLDGQDRTARILFTRKDDRLENREEVERWFEELGWLVVDQADLPFADQVRLTRSAGTVVVVDGAARCGVLFARPGLRIGELSLSPVREHRWFNEITRRLGHKLLILPGELVETQQHPIWPNFSSFRIERQQLHAFLERLEASN
jgi:Glycosyltransferase 61